MLITLFLNLIKLYFFQLLLFFQLIFLRALSNISEDGFRPT